MSLPFEYVFPAIRGIQAGREYYISMCPIRLIPKLFSFDDEEVPSEIRAQRTLNVARVPEIAKYILNNPTDYIFSAITASINADTVFESISLESDTNSIGRLRVPMDARFIINDGQHRRAAFELALKANPELGDETIAVVFFLDIGLKRSQQMFTDLNRYAAHPEASLNILYDYRDKKAILTKEVVKRVEVFRNLTEMERSSLTVRSSKLFTLSGIYSATQALLVNNKSKELEQQIEIASKYWNVVSQHISDWKQVLERKVSAGEIRKEYVNSHAVTLAGLGKAGACLIFTHCENWERRLVALEKIDWSRSNPYWEGRIMNGGQISKARACVQSMTVYLKKILDLPLKSEEKSFDEAHLLIGR